MKMYIMIYSFNNLNNFETILSNSRLEAYREFKKRNVFYDNIINLVEND